MNMQELEIIKNPMQDIVNVECAADLCECKNYVSRIAEKESPNPDEITMEDLKRFNDRAKEMNDCIGDIYRITKKLIDLQLENALALQSFIDKKMGD